MERKAGNWTLDHSIGPRRKLALTQLMRDLGNLGKSYGMVSQAQVDNFFDNEEDEDKAPTEGAK